MKPFVNASGILFYDGLKEPPLWEEAVKASNEAAYHHTGLERLPAPGLSGYKQLNEFLCTFTGAEDAFVVNNVLAAALLVFHTLARGKEIIVSREDLLSGKFSSSLLGVITQSGARLKKVGRKEGARLQDYSNAVNENTACILKISGNNGRSSFEESALVSLGEEDQLAVVKVLDLATLLNLTSFGLPEDWQVQKNVSDNFDIIIFAGDKLLGGPSLGIITGKDRYLSPIKKDPLNTALRADRMNMAALEATLELYLNEEAALQKIPLLRMITALPGRLEERAQQLALELKNAFGSRFEFGLAVEKASIAGKCSGHGILSSCQVSIASAELSARDICELLYKGDPPVIPRVKRGKVLLDMRSVPEEEDKVLLKSLLDSLREKEKQKSLVLDTVPSLIWVVDHENSFLFANKACGNFWGVDPESLIGVKMEEILKMQDRELLLEVKEKVLAEKEHMKMEVKLENSEGTYRWLDIILTPVFDGRNGISSVTFTASDVTDRKDNEEELKYIGMHDSLTGLYNRLYFEEEIRRLDTERHYPISIIVCDVDGLKLINDILGHSKGDELLQAAAGIIRKPFRASDVVARIGGDEFAVILPTTDVNIVKEIAGRINKAVEDYNVNKKRTPLSLSVGFATGTSAVGIREIFKQADSSMYKNKFERSDLVKRIFIESMMGLVAEKDFRNEGQEERLRRLVLLLGQAVGMPFEEIRDIIHLSRVHDIGKVGIDETILFKKEPLNDEEWNEIKSHPEIGCRIARFSPEMTSIADFILQHHESWDGSGYPRGLKGSNIHIYSRIIAIIDAYEAMTSPRPYRDPLTHNEAVEELKKNSGIQFDPRLVDIFINLIDQEYLI